MHGTSCVIMYIWGKNLIKSNVYREACFAVKITFLPKTYLTILLLLLVYTLHIKNSYNLCSISIHAYLVLKIKHSM